MQKKPYTTPTVTDHGTVVEKTKGRVGFSYEPIGIYLAEEDGKGIGEFNATVETDK